MTTILIMSLSIIILMITNLLQAKDNKKLKCRVSYLDSDVKAYGSDAAMYERTEVRLKMDLQSTQDDNVRLLDRLRILDERSVIARVTYREMEEKYMDMLTAGAKELELATSLLKKRKPLAKVGSQGRVKLPEVVMKQDLLDVGIRNVDIAKLCEVSQPATKKWKEIPKNKRSKVMKEVRRRYKLSGKLLNSGKK